MLGRGGRTWLLLILGIFLIGTPSGGWAGNTWGLSWGDFSAGRPQVMWVGAQTPMEAQLMGEKPVTGQMAPTWPPNYRAGLELNQEAVSTFRLPGNLELRISFLYNREQAPYTPERPIHSHLLFKYSMDYGLLPNLQVGFSGFYYHPQVDDLFYQRRLGQRAMAWGPGVRYDLGRWSFTFRSQIGTGLREGSDLQNWFRVWYAF